MRSLKTMLLTTLILLLGASGLRAEGTKGFDQAMTPILSEYLKIGDALAADRTEGVTASAARIGTQARDLDASGTPAAHAEFYKEIPTQLEAGAAKLEGAKTIDAMREAFKGLSRPLALWAAMARPEGIYTFYCAMAESSWLQKGEEVHNPYFGAKMPRCGEQVAGPDTGPGRHMMNMGESGHTMKTDKPCPMQDKEKPCPMQDKDREKPCPMMEKGKPCPMQGAEKPCPMKEKAGAPGMQE